MDLVDKIIKEIDQGLKFSLQNYQKQSREYPAKGIEDDSCVRSLQKLKKDQKRGDNESKT